MYFRDPLLSRLLRIITMLPTKSMSSRHRFRKAGLISFVFVMYSYTTAGPFGLEDQVATSGPGMTLIYHLVLPFFWCIPISLVVAELTSAMPVEGGFYRWTRAAFGDLWGFLAGWWNWCASFLLGGAYAVLFTDYLSFMFPNMSGLKHYCISVLLIAVIAYINVRGIDLVGKVATALTIVTLVPVAAMCLMSIRMWHYNPFLPVVPPHKPLFQVFGIGLALGLWLYSGYEQLSTVAEEVENPRKNYSRALAWVVPLSIATYFIPTACALAALGNWQNWHTRYFADAAQLIGGSWLGMAMTVAAVVMQISILNGTVVASTRMPFAMAEDGYLLPFLTRIHPKFGTPWLAILLSSAVYALLAWKSLTQLISVYMWLRIATSLLTVLAAWQLRKKRPDLERPFRIPWGRKGLAYAVISPVLMSGFALVTSDRFALEWGPVALLLGPLAYFFFRRSRRETVLEISSS
jgi:amino acid transporter